MTILWALYSARLCRTIWLRHNTVKEKTLGERLGDAEGKALTIALAATPADLEEETFAETMGDVADEMKVHTLAVTLPEVVAETVAIY